MTFRINGGAELIRSRNGGEKARVSLTNGRDRVENRSRRKRPPQEDILPADSYGRWRVSTQGSGDVRGGVAGRCATVRSSNGGD